MAPAHGATDGQDRDVKPSLLTSTGSADLHEGEEGPGDLKGLRLSLWFFFFLHKIHAFSWPIKGKVGHPVKRGDRSHRNTSHQFGLEPRTD